MPGSTKDVSTSPSCNENSCKRGVGLTPKSRTRRIEYRKRKVGGGSAGADPHFLLVYNVCMNPFEYLKALDHHAYFIHAFNDSVRHLKEYLKEKFHINHEQNPDVYHEKFDVLGIDQSRLIKEKHLSKSFSNEGKRIYIIETGNITNEAQNALLKVFEEPNTDTHFFLVMPSVHTLLPTLVSRLNILTVASEEVNTDLNKEIEGFLKLSKKDKVSYVDDIAKDLNDEKIDKGSVIDFLNALELCVYKRGVEKNSDALKAILTAKEYINDRSPSVKQLLEYVALSV